ncbi:MAG: DUF1830 domain-containing protein [Synechococcaceae bacterium WBA_2_066]|nr:DUF1830 domain-containing protein [Synechococcaceae bacterium WB6_1A_059]NBY60581.1 DUF1830 domain-containing protein [Synechococcaceae bacterium LLD_019]NCU76520.1 DUF1830 domain-containing protein [Synechococcaceae bacterium WB7_1C_051]NCU91148.1 DUF1830 domain-containing protein [Synechococcaceae bacterium WB7_1B_046]NCY14832.1 DUF1830 domain-containing protein [Synechococcaceae bacterium WB8_1A_041]NDA74915.1 DUF1830 domain-containing protein [Synechococcaceae bacterium WB8_3_299]NDE38
MLNCSYRNDLERMVILRCFGSNNYYLERVIFPFELLNFSAPVDAEVEIWSHGIGGPELVETLRSKELNNEKSPETNMLLSA